MGKAQEIILSNDIMIVSETNSKGKIKYANDDFCKIAGYTQEELLGQPHNIIRHEDMPKAAFKELWETIIGGRTWKGILKNKTKNGDFYWVNATAYPVERKNGKKRYISVRVKPTVEQVKQAEKLYSKLLKEE